MKIYLITIGQRMPNWVDEAFNEYCKRLPNDYALILKTLPTAKRSKATDKQRIVAKESKSLLANCPDHTYRIALDRQGKQIDSQNIATALKSWHDQSQNITLLIGGPEGISTATLQQADAVWSLSKLTLPHPLVRILVAEQIYRAWSILSNHPYHR